jgi:transcriptional regulator with XRE-family HTH domain
MVTFGQQMKAQRQIKGMTLEAVARRLGTHKGYVSGIENGKVNPPSAKIVKAFAKLYSVPYEEILLQAEIEKIHPDVREYVRMVIEAFKPKGQPPASAPAAVPAKAV